MKSLFLGLSLLPLTLLACGSSGSGTGNNGGDGGACGNSSTGSVVVTVTGLPAGVTGSVDISGSGSNGAQNVASGTITLPSDSYTVTANIVTQADPIVRTAYKGTVSVSTAQVCDGQTANVDVTYAQIPTSNKLWWGNQNGSNSTLGYASANLAASGGPAADVQAQTEGALPGAFDLEGNLWVIDGVEESVKEYFAATLASGGTKTPDVVISSDAFTGGIPGPGSLTFDPKGNLFVGIIFSKTIVEFDHEHLSATGSLTPNTTITTPDAPNALAFDKDDNLWAGCANDRVIKVAGAHNGGSVTSPPDVSIEAMTPSPVIGTLAAPIGLAFDASDNLWVNYNGTFAALTTADRSGSGEKQVTPAIQITPDVLSLPEGIAFDESGGLWFAYSAGKFAKFSSSQLAASGSVPPAIIVSDSNVASATSPAFYPAPKALPLYAAVQR